MPTPIAGAYRAARFSSTDSRRLLRMRCDIEGNIWCSIGWGEPREDGVRCYSSGGELLGKIHLPETCANLVFGGLSHNRLYMCATTSIYACYVNTKGAAL